MQPNTERLIDSLKNILLIHSPSGKESDCANFLAKHFSQYTCEIDTTGNVIIKIDGVGEPLLLAAHMDVVDPSNEIEMVIENGYIKNSKPYVLGIDDKSAIACFMEAVAVLNETNTPHRPLEILFTVEEETTSRGAIELDYKKISAKQGIIVDSAMPVGGIITESPFYGTLDITFSGPTHHTKNITKDEQTAWKIMSEIISALPHGSINEKTNINWSTISGGTGRNTVTGEFVIHGEIRSFDKSSYDQAIEIIEDMTNKNAEHMLFKHTYINAGYSVSKDDIWLTQITNALQKNGVSEIVYIKDYGVSDVNIIRNNDINIFNLSSGAQYTHTKDETISIKDLEIVTKVILEICTNK